MRERGAAGGSLCHTGTCRSPGRSHRSRPHTWCSPGTHPRLVKRNTRTHESTRTHTHKPTHTSHLSGISHKTKPKTWGPIRGLGSPLTVTGCHCQVPPGGRTALEPQPQSCWEQGLRPLGFDVSPRLSRCLVLKCGPGSPRKTRGSTCLPLSLPLSLSLPPSSSLPPLPPCEHRLYRCARPCLCTCYKWRNTWVF